jgi:hypothetical protein
VTRSPTRATSARRRPSPHGRTTSTAKKSRENIQIGENGSHQTFHDERENAKEINAKWGNRKEKRPGTASTGPVLKALSTTQQKKETRPPLVRRPFHIGTSRFNVKSRKFCPPKLTHQQRHVSIVPSSQTLACRSYANESVPAICLQRPVIMRPPDPCPGENATFFPAFWGAAFFS